MRASSAHAKTVPVISRAPDSDKVGGAVARDRIRVGGPSGNSRRCPALLLSRAAAGDNPSVKAHAIVNRVITTTLRVPQAGSGYELSLRLDIHRETGSTGFLRPAPLAAGSLAVWVL
jgi:hypothetical protein